MEIQLGKRKNPEESVVVLPKADATFLSQRLGKEIKTDEFNSYLFRYMSEGWAKVEDIHTCLIGQEGIDKELVDYCLNTY